MRTFTTDELTRMQAANVAAMQDTCVIGVYSATLDSNGASIPSYSFGSGIACGFKMGTARENPRTDMTVNHIDGTVRLPIGTSLKSTDQIKVTHRFGVAVTNVTYEVVGEIRRGPSGLQVDIAQVKP